MKVQIPDAMFPERDRLVADTEGQVAKYFLHLTLKNGEGSVHIALDFKGGRDLATILIPFLREHPDMKHGLEG